MLRDSGSATDCVNPLLASVQGTGGFWKSAF